MGQAAIGGAAFPASGKGPDGFRVCTGYDGMNESAKTSNQITEGVIWKQLLLFFFPLLFGTFFQMLYNTTDTIIVGRFIGTTALSAIGGAPAMIINLLMPSFTGQGRKNTSPTRCIRLWGWL